MRNIDFLNVFELLDQDKNCISNYDICNLCNFKYKIILCVQNKQFYVSS